MHKLNDVYLHAGEQSKSKLQDPVTHGSHASLHHHAVAKVSRACFVTGTNDGTEPQARARHDKLHPVEGMSLYYYTQKAEKLVCSYPSHHSTWTICYAKSVAMLPLLWCLTRSHSGS